MPGSPENRTGENRPYETIRDKFRIPMPVEIQADEPERPDSPVLTAIPDPEDNIGY